MTIASLYTAMAPLWRLLMLCHVVLSVFCQQQPVCPDDSLINPCCHCLASGEPSALPMIECFGRSGQCELGYIFQGKLPFNDFSELRIQMAHMTNLTADYLGDNRFRTVYLRYVSIDGPIDPQFLAASKATLTSFYLEGTYYKETFDLNIFDNATKLTDLTLTKSGLTTLQGSPHLPELQFANFNDNDLVDWPNFSNAPNLQRLHLKSNYIKKIPAHILRNNDRLMYLDTTWTYITSLTSYSLDLSGNTQSQGWVYFPRLSDIEANAIIGLGSDWVLDFGGSRFPFASETAFRPILEPLSQGSGQVVYGTAFSCNCSIAWLVREPALMKPFVNQVSCSDRPKTIQQLDETDIAGCEY